MALSPATLATQRASYVKLFLTERVYIHRRAIEKDAGGGDKPVWVLFDDVPGKVVRDTQPRESQDGDKKVSVDTWEIRVPWGTVIENTDKLIVSGVTYSVQGTDKGRSEARYTSVAVVKAK